MTTDWSEIRRVFETSKKPATEIARAFGVSARTVRGRAARENWRRPGEALRGAAPSKAATTPRNRAPKRSVYDVMETILTQELEAAEERLKEAIAAGEKLDIADRERNSRTLSNLVRTFDKVVEMKREILTNANAKEAPETAAIDQDMMESANADDIRREIKRRLDRLVADLHPDGVAEKSHD
ncbi:MAG: hypothetical protein AAF527_02235 [Pseudomonadota bacterium]